MNKRCGYIFSFGRDDSGMAATEFGLLAVPFVLILMGAFDLGYQMYVRSVLEGTLVDVARRTSLENPAFSASGATLEEKIEATMKDKIDSIARNATYSVSIKNFSDFSGIGKPEKLTTDVNGNGVFNSSHGDCWRDLNGNGLYDTQAGRVGVGGADDVVYYEVTMTMPRLFPMAGLLGASNEYSISTNTLFRSQPYAVQAVPDIKCGVVS
jgi:Flp pilus assembly protein TadG